MKKLILAIAVLAVALGCDGPQATVPEQTASSELLGKLREVRAQMNVQEPQQIEEVCAAYPPDPKPVVGFTIGEVAGSKQIKLPIYGDSQGLGFNGALLFLAYDDKHMTYDHVEIGEAWGDNFTYAADYSHPGSVHFLIIGWNSDPATGYGAIPPSTDPWAYLVFNAVKPGKSKVAEEAVEAHPYNYTAEMLVNLCPTGIDGTWSVGRFNGTTHGAGTITVSPGDVTVKQNAAEKAAPNVSLRLQPTQDPAVFDLVATSNLPMIEVTVRIDTDATLADLATELDSFDVTVDGQLIIDLILWQYPFGSGKLATLTFATTPTLLEISREVPELGLPTQVVCTLDYKLTDKWDPFNPGEIVILEPDQIRMPFAGP